MRQQATGLNLWAGAFTCATLQMPLRRTLRGRFTELERQLAAAQSTQRADADERPRLEGAAARLQGRLAEVEEQAAQTRQQLWWVP